MVEVRVRYSGEDLALEGEGLGSSGRGGGGPVHDCCVVGVCLVGERRESQSGMAEGVLSHGGNVVKGDEGARHWEWVACMVCMRRAVMHC